jgi:uncharacterized protein YkwD
MALATKTKTKSRPPAAHKKRTGQHHKHNKHYLKSYWPYLPMLAVVGLGLVINTVWSKVGVLGASNDYSAQTLLADTNVNRAQDGEPALTLDPELTAAAQAKAEDLVTKDYWAHNSPAGKTPWDFITQAGYQYQKAGENLAYGFSDADSAEVGWMNSPEHKANILDADYQNVGFATASSPNYQGRGPETVVVAEYGDPVVAAANITFTVPQPTGGSTSAIDTKIHPSDIQAQNVSRIQLLTGGHATWSLFAVTLLASGALVAFLLRHGLRLQRAVTSGETFIAHHPLLDITIMVLIMAGFVLTRTSGIIR